MPKVFQATKVELTQQEVNNAIFDAARGVLDKLKKQSSYQGLSGRIIYKLLGGGSEVIGAVVEYGNTEEDTDGKAVKS